MVFHGKLYIIPMNALFLSIGHVASILGVSTKTLRRWDKKGMLNADFRTLGHHRRYAKGRILSFIGKKSQKKCSQQCVIYSRVSSSRQKKSGDLKRQESMIEARAISRGYKIYRKYSDVGSGLNDSRKGLLKLLKDASLGKFEVVVVNYKDRLARFGLNIIREYLNSWNVRLEVIHPHVVDDSPHAELITDLTSILYSFMGKLYRMRRMTPNQ